jgi:hypothetical protein
MSVLCEVLQCDDELQLEGLRRVSVVVKVHLDLTEIPACELGEAVEKLGPVLLTGKEEGVPRWRAVGIAITIDQDRITLPPGANALSTPVLGCASPERLVVIAQGKEEVPRTFTAFRHGAPREVPNVARQPATEVFFS